MIPCLLLCITEMLLNLILPQRDLYNGNKDVDVRKKYLSTVQRCGC